MNDYIIETFHNGPWKGYITEVGLGVPLLDMFTRVDGCSKSLYAGNVPYNSVFQPGLNGRSVSRKMAETMAHEARHQLEYNKCWDECSFTLAVTGSYKAWNERGQTHAWVALLTQDCTQVMHFSIPNRNRQNAITLAGAITFVFLGIHLNDDMPYTYSSLIDLAQKWGVDIDVIDSSQFIDTARQLELVTERNPLVYRNGELVRNQDVFRNMTRVYRGAFNPPTLAHQVIGSDAVFEISLDNADKGDADYTSVAHRINMLALMGKTVMVTKGAPLFFQFDQLLDDLGVNVEDIIYVMGYDTYSRVIDKKYYPQQWEKQNMLEWLHSAQLEVAGTSDELINKGLGEKEWRGKFINLSHACDHPYLELRSTPVREGGVEHIHSCPQVVQDYIQEYNPYNFCSEAN